MRSLVAIAILANLQTCSCKFLYFPTTAGRFFPKTYIMQLDLSGSTHKQTTVLEYPMGPYNPGGGGTGICRLGNMLYWGDQTTVTVHSAELTGTKLTNHDPSFIANLTDPQGVACDASSGNVYIVDSIPGGGLRAILFRSTKPNSPTQTLSVSGLSAARSIKVVDGSLWFGSDSGIFRSDQKAGVATLAEVGLSGGKIYEDIEIVPAHGQNSLVFASTYDWGGVGVLESTLNSQHQNLTAPFQPMKGAGCQKGSEMTWGLAADSDAQILYWVVIDDADPPHVKIMYQSYESSGPAKVAYSAVGSGHGIYLDAEDSDAVVV
eukprot:TRINITY_DN84086_c0_g1_i1.p1 TRINITY_DN84086_c0_g1~~TRINITY_DN84086_c0_g1_i1.p1  ORF type:complete len:320 (+),score=46.29 TRINITY_DN84086_c0_g1_i1:59-1018(+)